MPETSLDVGPFRLTVDDDAAWFVFRDDVGLVVAERLSASVAELTAALAPVRAELAGKRLIADMRDQPVIDSVQIGAMIALNKACRPFGRLALAHVSDGVAKLLRVTAVERLFDFVDDSVGA